MSRADVQVVVDQFEAVNERDFERAMSLYAEDVELYVDPRAFLECGTFEGREAVGEWFGNWFRTFERDYRFDIEETRDLGDAVLLVASHHGRGRGSGVEVRGSRRRLPSPPRRRRFATDTSTGFARAGSCGPSST